jgi:WD40 repeat protein
MAIRYWLIALTLFLCRMAAAVPRSTTRPAIPSSNRLQPYLALGHTALVTAEAWSPDGRTLATGSLDQTVILWDRATWQPRATLSGYAGQIDALAWSPDGRWLVASDGERSGFFRGILPRTAVDLVSAPPRRAILWDTETGKKRVSLIGQTGALVALAWNPDGRTIAGADGRAVFLWDARTGRQCAKLPANNSILAWSPDGRTLVTDGSAEPATAVLWDVRTARARRTLAATESITRAVDWSPDGTQLAIADEDRAVLLWDVANGRHRILLDDHQATPESAAHLESTNPLAWSPDSRLLATGKKHTYNGVLIWDAATGKQIVALKGPDVCRALAWSPDGTTLAMEGSNATALWDRRTGQQRLVAGETLGPLAWGRDGKLLSSLGPRSPLPLREGETGRLVPVLPSHVVSISHLAWNPEGTALAVGSAGGDPITEWRSEPRCFVRVWSPRRAEPVATLTRLGPARQYLAISGDTQYRIFDLAWSPAGHTLATTSGHFGLVWGIDGIGGHPTGWERASTILWEPRSGERRATLAGAVASLAWRPDGKLLATENFSYGVALWDPATGQNRGSLASGCRFGRLAWSPDGKTLATSGYVGRQFAPLLWDAESGHLRQRLTGPEAGDGDLAWRPDGRMLAVAHADHSVTLWDAATATLRHTLTLPSHPHQSITTLLAWRPDGGILATGSPVKEIIRLWNPENGRLLALLHSPRRGLGLLAWSPDGQTLAAATGESIITLWNVSTRGQRIELFGHTAAITALQWSPNGRLLATGSLDGSVRLWNAATGRERLAFYSLDEGKEWLAITPDGYFAASPHGADDLRWRQGTRLWPLSKFRHRFERPDRVRKALAVQN